MLTFHPVFVIDGVYLRSETGEQIGRLDPSGSPFESLDEARDHADWLEMLLNLQQSNHRYDREITSIPRPAGSALSRV
jgi:hypothetical protein